VQEALEQLDHLGEAERELLKSILKRGRTLSYRALTQEAHSGHPHP